MIVKSDFPESVRVDLRVAYDEGRQAVANPDYKQLIRVETTTSDAKKHVFYGDKGRLRRFRGERQPQKFNEYEFMLKADEWELTHTVKKSVIENDQSGGILRSKIQNFGTAVETSLEIETMEYLRNGSSVLGFDNKRLFDFFHTYTTSDGRVINDFVGATQSNMHLGGSQLDATILQLERSAYAQIKSDKGKALGARLTHVLVQEGSNNHKNAMELSNSTFTVEASTVKGQMTTNVFKGSFGILTSVYGFGASEWFTFDLSDPEARPIIVLSHVQNGWENMEYTELLSDSTNGFWRNELAYGVRGKFDWNPGDWRTARLRGTSDYTFVPSDNERQVVSAPN